VTAGAPAPIMEFARSQRGYTGTVEMSEAAQQVIANKDDVRHPIDWHDHVDVDPRTLAGKPIVKGTRIGVEFLLRLFAGGWSEQEVLENYPHITREDLRAIFALAADIVGEEWWSVLPSRDQ